MSNEITPHFDELENKAHHFRPEDIESSKASKLGGSALNPANVENLSEDEASLASKALRGDELSPEEEEALRDIFRDGTVGPGEDVAADW